MGSKYEYFKVQEEAMKRGWEEGQGGEMNRVKSTKSGPGDLCIYIKRARGKRMQEY